MSLCQSLERMKINHEETDSHRFFLIFLRFLRFLVVDFPQEPSGRVATP